MNIYDILILSALALAVFLAVLRIMKNRKKGNICGGNCSCCGGCSSGADFQKKKKSEGNEK